MGIEPERRNSAMIDPQVAHPIIAEWVKVLIGAIVGFVSGVFTDFLKNALTEKKRKKRLRYAIYSELMQMYTAARVMTEIDLQKTSTDKARAVFRSLRIDAYEFAKSQADIFFELREAFVIEHLYRKLHFLNHIDELDTTAIYAQSEQFVKSINDVLDDGELNRKVFSRAAETTFGNRKNGSLPQT
jgi:hypothetical protein